MELVGLDLDATLLNRQSKISDYTSDTPKEMPGLGRRIGFGDRNNGRSRFEAAGETYAAADAGDAVKSATAVIGHHDEEGMFRFLRERFAPAEP
jgi:hydroxymethylpyrimidine pyrophosphatase-like HAD family hydrolase